MPRTDLGGALEVAERLRGRPRPRHWSPVFRHQRDRQRRCVVSRGEEADALLQRVDTCLFGAKASGRNRIVTTLLSHDGTSCRPRSGLR